MTIHQLKKELLLTNKKIAGFFELTTGAYANSSAKPRYENALCKFYEHVRQHQKTTPDKS